ncbi:3-hydroxypropionyl-coenzyme A synthetase [Candidatus Lokiarchaeum ossiferum]|uniref:3-hydroxypropionyl-coenzyme A synthetase n=1 Tax=Candidatus Lokiarchaeum ossiferum TaxID=2951803 RepID=A0ABY6HPS4_9ARCH|nr:3-hydroxypropionyl-coenzyme A synthetase [Candidatus Lokiarchaeum sp. B-35]
MGYSELYKKSIEEPEVFWGEIAENLHWFKKWDKVLDSSNPPFYRWFAGAETNICYNAVDRWATGDHAKRSAFIYENPVDEVSTSVSYEDLFKQVNEVAGLYQHLGLKKGDRVIIYLPMSIEACVAALACTRIGLIHSIIFAGFSKESIAVRIDDAKPKLIICADGSKRAGKVTDLKSIINDAVDIASFKVPKVLVVDFKIKSYIPINDRDLDWKTELASCPIKKVDCTSLKSDDPSYILYTSGTTGKPKGALRDTAGYMVALYYSIFSLYGCKDDSVYFATSDIGWVVGHSYTIYGPLIAGLTSIIYDGTPIHGKGGEQNTGIWFETMAKVKADVVFSSPTAFRVLRKYPEENITKHDLSKLRYLFLAGEPLDPPTYNWVKDVLKGIDIVDNYWQTETGWPVLCNPVGVDNLPIKAGSPSFPTWTWNLEVVDEEGNRVNPDVKGFLVAHPPTPPGFMMTVYGDDQRFIDTYWKVIPGKDMYYTGDYAIVDPDGYYYVLGRADEVIKVASHRLGTREIEELLNSHPAVAENMVIGIIDEVKGQAPLVLVVLKEDIVFNDELKKEMRLLIREGIGPIATPKEILNVSRLPKTRSGKVMRRIIKSIAEGKNIGDISTIEDGASVEEVRKAIEPLLK